MNLYPHQVDTLKATEGRNRVAYYLDMGLGKTYVGSEKMYELNRPCNLVICQKSKIKDWLEHFDEHYNVFLYDLTTRKGFDSFFSQADLFSPRVGIINYELAWRRKDLLKLHGFTLMLDESSLIQNKTAKQTKFILKLDAANVILLSGTPTSGKYENLWTQAHLLGWNISETMYNRQYINWKLIDVPGGMKVKVVDKANPYKNVERLKAKFREHGAVFMKTEDVMTLPQQNFIEVKVSKSKEYTRFMKDGIVTVNGVELVGDTTFTARLYARQLCGQYSQGKLEAFSDLLQSTNDRIIVFYNFTAEMEALKAVCEAQNRPVAVVNGEHKEVSTFEENPSCVLLGQYQAASMGLNLQKANKIIYFSLPERSDLFEQSKKRIHRIGQTQPCFYYVMMCAGSIEGDIYEALKQKRDYTDELFAERNKE